MYMRRQGQGELFPFDLEPKRTLNQLRGEQREAHQRNLAVMQNQEEQDPGKRGMRRMGDIMGIMVGIMLSSRLYSQMILLCCYKSLLYHLRLFSRLYETIHTSK